MRLRCAGLALALLFAWHGPPARAQASDDVDLLLVLAVDCSDSVMRWEFHQQTRGLADAFETEEVQAAIRSGPRRRIAVMLVQWAGYRVRRVAVPWTVVSTKADALALSLRIREEPRTHVNGETSLSGAIDFAVLQIITSPYSAPRQVIDISGDGRNSDGPEPRPARDRALSLGITVNGLAILNDVPTLDSYYMAHVTGGHDSFVMTASDFVAYREAIQRKLVKEISIPSS